MIEAYEEMYYWQELRYGIAHLIGQLDEYRTECMSYPWEDMPEFNGLEELLNGVTEYIDGRMQELAPNTISDQIYEREAKQIAQEALSQGINYFGLSELVPEDKPRAMEYIKKHGLASMSYILTRKAVLKFREEELNERSKRYGRNTRVLLLSR